MHKTIRLYNLIWLSVALLIVLFDQVTKYYFLTHTILYGSKSILPWLNFTLKYNTGAAFSFLAEFPGWQQWFLGMLAVIVSGILVGWMLFIPSQLWLALCALSLIVGGALSNVIDRVWHGYVIDFIDFHIYTWHFATFNVADSAITVGAIVLGALLIFKKL